MLLVFIYFYNSRHIASFSYNFILKLCATCPFLKITFCFHCCVDDTVCNMTILPLHMCSHVHSDNSCKRNSISNSLKTSTLLTRILSLIPSCLVVHSLKYIIFSITERFDLFLFFKENTFQFYSEEISMPFPLFNAYALDLM